MVDSKSKTSFNIYIPEIYITLDDYKNILLSLYSYILLYTYFYKYHSRTTVAQALASYL